MTVVSTEGFFSLLFNLLRERGIRYVVLRNYEELPEKPLEGSDVDLLIDRESEQKYLEVLKEAANLSESYVVLKSRQLNCLSCFIYQKKNHRFGTWVDAFTEISTKGFVWADSNFLLEKRAYRSNKGFFIPPRGGEAAVLFLKGVLNHRFIKDRYCWKILNLVHEDREGFIRTLQPYFRREIIQDLLQICFQSKWEEGLKKRWALWIHLVLRNFRSQPLVQISRFFNYILSSLRKLIGLKGIMISIMGPDGVGKTTTCEGLKRRVKRLFFRRIYYYHSHVGFFPELGRIYHFIFREKFLPRKGDLRGAKAIGLFSIFLRLLYYGFEGFLSWPWILWLKVRGNLIVFDRYFYDFAVTSSSNRFLLSAFFWISKVIPPPDIVFIMQARAEVINMRKKELDLKEIRRQLDTLQDEKIVKLARTIFVNSEETQDDVLETIEEEIVRFFCGKYAE